MIVVPPAPDGVFVNFTDSLLTEVATVIFFQL